MILIIILIGTKYILNIFNKKHIKFILTVFKKQNLVYYKHI